MGALTIRIVFGEGRAVGPGKIRLLELIGETGSIAAAGRAMAMSYRRAWLLTDELNAMFRHKVVDTQMGGLGGGGAQLTAFGRDLVREYRAIERGAAESSAGALKKLERYLA